MEFILAIVYLARVLADPVGIVVLIAGFVTAFDRNTRRGILFSAAAIGILLLIDVILVIHLRSDAGLSTDVFGLSLRKAISFSLIAAIGFGAGRLVRWFRERRSETLVPDR